MLVVYNTYFGLWPTDVEKYGGVDNPTPRIIRWTRIFGIVVIKP